MTKEKKDCNCKAKKDINKLVKTIDDINLSSSKNHIRKANFINKIIIEILKYLIYFILFTLLSIFIVPIILFIILFSVILKKTIKIKMPFQKSNKSI